MLCETNEIKELYLKKYVYTYGRDCSSLYWYPTLLNQFTYESQASGYQLVSLSIDLGNHKVKYFVLSLTIRKL